MNLAEVVVGEVQRDHVSMHLDLLAKRVAEPSEAAHVHPHGQVLPLNVAGRDMALVWISGDCGGLDARDLGRRVAMMGGAARVHVRPVVLLQHRVVDVDPEGVLNGVQVDLMAVGRQLDARREPAGHVGHEVVGVSGGALPDAVSDDQLGVGIDSRPRPDIAPLSALLLGHVLGLGAYERPDFIALNAARLQGPRGGVVVGGAGCAEIAQELFDGHPSHASHARGPAQAVAFDQSSDDGGAALSAQLIHSKQYTCSC